MIGIIMILALLIAAVAWLVVAGTGRNRDGIVEWEFGNHGLSRFAMYDGPLIPQNRATRRAAERGKS